MDANQPWRALREWFVATLGSRVADGADVVLMVADDAQLDASRIAIDSLSRHDGHPVIRVQTSAAHVDDGTLCDRVVDLRLRESRLDIGRLVPTLVTCPQIMAACLVGGGRILCLDPTTVAIRDLAPLWSAGGDKAVNRDVAPEARTCLVRPEPADFDRLIAALEQVSDQRQLPRTVAEVFGERLTRIGPPAGVKLPLFARHLPHDYLDGALLVQPEGVPPWTGARTAANAYDDAISSRFVDALLRDSAAPVAGDLARLWLHEAMYRSRFESDAASRPTTGDRKPGSAAKPASNTRKRPITARGKRLVRRIADRFRRS